jgi:hypothetical protein
VVNFRVRLKFKDRAMLVFTFGQGLSLSQG